uniref:Uncharacterized protein n=1 Tax=Arundo donax TaxID=35708 RepID=A0A0A8ZVY5_ARUDO
MASWKMMACSAPCVGTPHHVLPRVRPDGARLLLRQPARAGHHRQRLVPFALLRQEQQANGASKTPSCCLCPREERRNEAHDRWGVGAYIIDGLPMPGEGWSLRVWGPPTRIASSSRGAEGGGGAREYRVGVSECARDLGAAAGWEIEAGAGATWRRGCQGEEGKRD